MLRRSGSLLKTAAAAASGDGAALKVLCLTAIVRFMINWNALRIFWQRV
jgi:hypothetical protein